MRQPPSVSNPRPRHDHQVYGPGPLPPRAHGIEEGELLVLLDRAFLTRVHVDRRDGDQAELGLQVGFDPAAQAVDTRSSHLLTHSHGLVSGEDRDPGPAQLRRRRVSHVVPRQP